MAETLASTLPSRRGSTDAILPAARRAVVVKVAVQAGAAAVATAREAAAVRASVAVAMVPTATPNSQLTTPMQRLAYPAKVVRPALALAELGLATGMDPATAYRARADRRMQAAPAVRWV